MPLECIEHVLGGTFKKAGLTIGRFPLPFMALALVIFGAFGAFIGRREAETAAERLWVPDSALALKHQDTVRADYSSDFAPSVIVAVDKQDGGDILDHFKEFADLIVSVRAVQVSGTDIAKRVEATDEGAAAIEGTWSYYGDASADPPIRKKCWEFTPGICAETSILNAVPEAYWEDKTEILRALNTYDTAPMNSPVDYGAGQFAFKSFELEDVLGGVKRDADNKIVSAEFVQNAFLHRLVNIDYGSGANAANGDPVATEWEARVVCIMGILENDPESGDKCTSPWPGSLKLTGFFVRTFGDEFGNAVRGDVGLLSSALMLVAAYVFIFLGKKDSVHSAIALSCASLLCVGGAIVVSYGGGGILGIKTNPLLNNIPFLLLGLGVDASFVLRAEFNAALAEAKAARNSTPGNSKDGGAIAEPAPKQDQMQSKAAGAEMTPEELNAMLVQVAGKAAETGGVSLLVSSFTDALAFGIGASTQIPALSSFCIYSALGVVGAFLFIMIIFLPALVFDAKRTERQRLDCLCCIKAKEPHTFENPQGCCNPCCGCLKAKTMTTAKPKEISIALQRAGVDPRTKPAEYSWAPCFYPDGVLERTLFSIYETLIHSTPLRLALLAAWFALFIMGVVGLVEQKTDFDVRWFIPNESYFFETEALINEYVGTSQLTVRIVVENRDLEQKAQLEDLSKFLGADGNADTKAPEVQAGTASYWYAEFPDGPNGETTDEAHKRLYKWLGSAGRTYLSDIIWANADCNEDRETVDVQGWLDQAVAMGQDLAALTGEAVSDVYQMTATQISTAIGAGQLPPNLQTSLDTMVQTEAAADAATCHVDGIRSFQASFTMAFAAFNGDGAARYETLQSMRSEMLQIFEHSDDTKAFPFATDFVFWEEFGIISDELLRNIVTCTIVITALIVIMVPQPRVAACTLICIGATVTQVGGFLHFWDITLSSTATIYLLIVIGLAVDACVHIGHFFALIKGTPEKPLTAQERAAASGMRIGPSVMHALFSTLLAVLALSQSQSWVFMVFFKTLCLQVLFSMLNGLLVLPVLLSFLGGSK